MKKKVALLTNASRSSGVGSRAYHIARSMPSQEDLDIIPILLDGSRNVIEVKGEDTKSISSLPGILGSKSISWVRLGKYLSSYDLYDISNQTLSFLAKKHHPSIVTVHDIIELTDPQDSRAALLNRYLMSGITSADRIVTVSEYTKKEVSRYYAIPESSITVVPNAAAPEYTPLPDFSSSIGYQSLMRDFKLSGKEPILITVSSEHPRKNIETTLRVISHLKRQYPNILLLKVGDAGIPSGRKYTLELIDSLGLQQNVKLLGTVSNEALNEFYNIADALIFPSRAEGFGMPPLEAMAAGLPVVCSNTTSLPEVVADAGLLHDSENVEAFAASVSHIVGNREFRKTLIQKGLERAKQFSWEKSAHAMLEIYRTFV